MIGRGLVFGLGLAALGCFGGDDEPPAPDPQEVLARIGAPPAPVLSPEEALAAFRVAPGFRVELVAAEPLVEDPVAVDWDDAGRLYVVEMRGYMPRLDGAGEDEPVGRVVVLEDEDGDGVLDRRQVFLDGLVMPRAIAVLPQGVLIGAPPDLFLCRDEDRDLRCDRKLRVAEYAAEGNVEHSENGLVTGLDNWIYSASSKRRFRWRGDTLVEDDTASRGQWGLVQDDVGRFVYNNNSQFLIGDVIPSEFLERHPGTDPRLEPRAGLSIGLANEAEVHTIRVNPGVNRAYQPRTLREDGRLFRPTAVSGLALQRSGGFGDEHRGDVFVPEPGGNVVAHFRVVARGNALQADHVLYPDETWEQREFLASTDERFRPVSAAVGPDGTLLVVDMYRGVIQHATYVSEYLHDYVSKQELERPLGLGRLYRIVREGRPPRAPSPALDRASTAEWIAALQDADGWWRERAQRRLVAQGGGEAVAALRALPGTPLGRVHALFTLEGLGALDAATLVTALAAAEPEVRAAALHAGAGRLAETGTAELVASFVGALEDPDARVRLYALLALGELPGPDRPLEAMVARWRAEGGDSLWSVALLSGSAGREIDLLALLVASAADEPDSSEAREFFAETGRVLFRGLHAAGDLDALAAFLDVVDAMSAEEQGAWRKLAVLDGLASIGRRPDFERPELPRRPALFAETDMEGSEPLPRALRRARAAVTWPGDTSTPGVVPLSEAQQARMDAGAPLFTACAACHQEHGRGLPGLAPSLAASPYVLDSDDWLVRIVLHGLAGPIDVHGERWEGAMPGHGADPRFADDARVAGLLTYLRRSFGNTGDPVDPETVARVRAETEGRSVPFSADELFALPAPNRLDRYAGSYKIENVPLMRLRIERIGAALQLSAPGAGDALLVAQPDGSFRTSHPDRGEIQLSFLEGDDGRAEAAEMRLPDQTVTWTRVE